MNKKIKFFMGLLCFGVASSSFGFNLDEVFGGGKPASAPAVESNVGSKPATKATAPEQYKFSRSEAHQQWVLKCVKGQNSGREKCNLIHQINNKQGQQIVKIEVLQTGKETADNNKQILFHLPLGTWLPAGAVLKVGDMEERMSIQICLPAGCQARTNIGMNLHQALSRGSKGVVQLLNQNQRQKINIEFSLMGYAKGVEGVL